MMGSSLLSSPSIQAVIATTTIGLLPWLVLIPILYFSKTGNYTNPFSPRTLRLLLCFSVGSFLGDACLHLIPHAFAHLGGGSHHHDHDHHDHHDLHLHHDEGHHHSHDHSKETMIGIYLLAGVLIFFIIERLTSILAGGHSHGASSDGDHDGSAHHHDQQQQGQQQQQQGQQQQHHHDQQQVVFTAPDSTKSCSNHHGFNSNNDPDTVTKRRVTGHQQQQQLGQQQQEPHCGDIKSIVSPSSTCSPNLSSPSPTTTTTTAITSTKVDHGTAFVTLIADLIHNFTDGMAIAAAFLTSDPTTSSTNINLVSSSLSSFPFLSKVAVSTCFAIIFHEIPHEIADFSLLLRSGITMRNACLMQCLTAIGSIMGCIFGILTFHNLESGSDAFLPLTAGGFLYVGCSLMKSLHDHDDHGDNQQQQQQQQQQQHHDTRKSSQLYEFAIELLSISLGIGIMYIIAILE